MTVSALRISKPKLPVSCPEDWLEEEFFEPDPRAESVCYRGQALAIINHFFELSSQAGRLPSLLCREFFRAKVTHHAIPSFEEQIIFVRDVELCLERLSDEHAEMIQLVGLYDFSNQEIGAMLHRSLTWVWQRVTDAVDALVEVFLQAGLIDEHRPDRRQRQVTDRSLPADVLAAGKKPCASAEASTGALPGEKPCAAEGVSADVPAVGKRPCAPEEATAPEDRRYPAGISDVPPWPESWTG